MRPWRVVPALLAGALCLGVTTPAQADDLQQKQAQQKQLEGQIGSLQAQLQRLQAQEASTEALLRQTEALIVAQESLLASENATLDATLGKIDDTQHQLQAKRNEEAQRQVVLDARTRILYKEEGDVSFLDSLFSANNFSQLLDRFLVMRDITHADQLLLQQIRTDRAQIEALLTQLGQARDAQQAAVNQVRATEAQLNLTYARATSLRASEAQTQSSIQQQQAASIRSLAQVKSEIAQLQAARRYAHSSGVFAWPGVQGPITQPFGCTDYGAEPPPPQPYSCPSSRPYFHYGIDIGGPWGSRITAADSGVAYTYVSSYGYGDHVIIVHANGYATLYGHMSSFAITSGQNVAKGQLIGFEGSTGNSSGPHLHFEIDLNGTPVNPCNYVGC